MNTPVIPCQVETITHPDGRVDVIVKPDVLKLRGLVGEEEAARIIAATQGKTISSPSS